MSKTLRELAGLVEGEVVGDADTVISGCRGIEDAGPGEITFVANRRYYSLIPQTRASAIIVSKDVAEAPKPMLRVADPSLAFAQVMAALHPVVLKHPEGIHETAVVAKSALLGRRVALGPHVVVEENARIGDDTVLYAGCYVGRDTTIGARCLLWPNVSVRERVTIGDRVSIQSGTVIGSEGFGYVNVGGVFKLIPQVGSVLIEDDVEIGANVTIDRARFDKTVIGQGTKIDNLVQIAHNVVIGRHCMIVSQVGISGSTHLGDRVTLAGQVGLVGHITVGDGAIVTAQSGVPKSVPPGAVMSGYPAVAHEDWKKNSAYIHRLPELSRAVRELAKRVEELQARLGPAAPPTK
jgi:UDP-3-O-[3-hydroxymyristoyl] glucosamine N-acyltransferase